MSKVSSYLQNHLVGEVVTRADVRELYSRDGSVLYKTPSMVVFPRTVNDIRKVVRFSTQLAEKGHVLSVTVRGEGTSTSASALSGDIVIDTTKYLGSVLEYDQKQKLVRAQAGATEKTLSGALGLSGAAVSDFDTCSSMSVGGWIGEGVGSGLGRNYQVTKDTVTKLEIVLAGGEVIQTGRLSKRELNKKKGIQGAEGDIYRGIETVLEDYADVVDKLRSEPYADMSGYPGIVDVQARDGSFDLTPLFIGAQGTLGIVIETILKTEFQPSSTAYAVASFYDGDTARDALDLIRKHNPSFVDYFDSQIIQTAVDQGVSLQWFEQAKDELKSVSHVIVYGWSGFNERSASRSLKKVQKQLEKVNCYLHTSDENEEPEKLQALRNISLYTRHSTTHINEVAPRVIGGFYIPVQRFEDFSMEIAALAGSLRVDLPLYGSALDNIYTVLPQLSLQKVGDKQKVLKLVDKLMQLVEKHDGVYYAHGGEGWLTSRFARANWSDRQRDMVDAIRKVFDPHTMLNQKTKTDSEIKDIIDSLVSDNTISSPQHLSGI